MAADPTKEVVSGEWYFGLKCEKCGKLLPAFHDPSRGKVKIAGAGRLSFECGRCRHRAEYGADDFQRSQAQH
jgi:hypothetical protein